MYEYTVTYSGGYEDDVGGEDWVDFSNIFDGDETTSGTVSVSSEMVYTIPYSWTRTFSNTIVADAHDNTTSSGDIMAVYAIIYGYQSQEETDLMGTVEFYYTGIPTGLKCYFTLPTTTGSFTACDITSFLDYYWDWDWINDLELGITITAGFHTSSAGTIIDINKIGLLIVTWDEEE